MVDDAIKGGNSEDRTFGRGDGMIKVWKWQFQVVGVRTCIASGGWDNE